MVSVAVSYDLSCGDPSGQCLAVLFKLTQQGVEGFAIHSSSYVTQQGTKGFVIYSLRDIYIYDTARCRRLCYPQFKSCDTERCRKALLFTV